MRLILLAATIALFVGDALAETKKSTVIVSPPGSDTTIGKIDGETILLKKTPTGTVGKIGKDKVILHKDGNGNTIGKVGNEKVFCHSDAATGLTICK
jgi:hypothetical protein